MLVQGEWHGCYRDGWQGLIVPDAFAHPAKFSRNLIARIYDHMREEGWLPEGSTVLDPFGGVALGALDAMRLGCSWVGVELEEKFVKLGMENIIYWHRRFGTMPKWGEAVLLQGDSRKLLAWNFAGGQVEAVVGSPPFADTHKGNLDEGQKGIWGLDPASRQKRDYLSQSSSGNLGNLPDRGFDAAIGSPPFSPDQPCASQSRSKKDYHAFTRVDGTKRDHEMRSPGQLAAMPEGSVDAAISSPPYVSGGHHPDQTGAWGGQAQANTKEQAGYGGSPGQMGRMPEGAFEGVVSSPPFQESTLTKDKKFIQAVERDQRRGSRLQGGNMDAWGENPSNLGNSSGDTFWSAARQILEQVFLCVRPGGHAVWVVKAFVRKGKLVDFPDQWRQLCEAVGFRTLHCHRASLVEDDGTHLTTEGGEQRLTKERKSFFRRLAERKGAPRIDYEVVWCMERLPLGRG